MNQKFQTKFKTMRNDMQSNCKTWSGYNASLPDVANSIRTWIKTMEELAVHDDSNTPAFAKAHQYLKSAWVNRDDKIKLIKMAGLALKELEGLEAEAETPETEFSGQKRSAKAVWGENDFYSNSKNSTNTEIYGVQKKLEAFVLKGSENVYTSSVKSVKADIQSIANQFEVGSKKHQYAVKAISDIDRAVAHKHSARDYGQNLKNAIKTLDNIAVLIDNKAMPANYVAPISPEEKREVVRQVRALKSLLESYNFYQPSELSNQILRRSKTIQGAIKSRRDMKAERIAGIVEKHMILITDLAKNPRIKSTSPDLWRVPEILNSLQLGLEAVGALEDHFEMNY